MAGINQEEIKRRLEHLPRWARVAFAARCARRVQPIFTLAWPDAPSKHVESIERAINLAEQSAEAALPYVGEVDVNRVAVAHAAASHAAAASAAYAARIAAAYAADAAHAAAVLAPAGRAPCAAAEAAEGAETTPATGAAIFNDLENLERQASDGRWTDDTPVPPTVFGPMWPNGAPNWNPIAVAAAHESDTAEDAPITIYREPGVVTPEEYADLINALGNAVRAHGGLGIQLVDDHGVRIPVRAPETLPA